jgi:inosose dehydratase
MDVRVGSAPDSWGVWFPENEKQTPWNRFLDEITEAGYEWTELGPYGYLPTDLDTLRGELDSRGLRVSGTFIMANLENPDSWPGLEKQVLDTGELLAQLGAKFLVLIDNLYTDLFTGELTETREMDGDARRRLAENSQRAGELAKDRFDLSVVFHPHAETHVEYEHEIEDLLEHTDAVSLCLDIGHHAYRGGDPFAFMRKHHERIPYLHLKSVDRDVQRRVEDEQIPFASAVAMDMFVEPSRGAVDFVAFRDLLEEINFQGWGIVEQDMYPAPFDKPLPIAKRTREYLREIGIG